MDTDSDCAGCVLTRKNTTCAHLVHGVNLIKAVSWTQGTRSLSVAESVFYAAVKGASIVLGAESMMVDFVLLWLSHGSNAVDQRSGDGRTTVLAPSTMYFPVAAPPECRDSQIVSQEYRDRGFSRSTSCEAFSKCPRHVRYALSVVLQGMLSVWLHSR